MGRLNRVVVAGLPHHVSHQGNDRQRVFFQESDYLLYLNLVQKHSAAAGVRLLAYCLLPNQADWVVIPGRAESLARVFGRAHMEYALALNLQRGRCGHLWQGRFLSCVLDDTHRWRAMAYIERNPVRTGLVTAAKHWRWSSARAHGMFGVADMTLDMREWREHFGPESWYDMLGPDAEEPAFGRRLLAAARAGRPLADPQFVAGLERLLGRRLQRGKTSRRTLESSRSALVQA